MMDLLLQMHFQKGLIPMKKLLCLLLALLLLGAPALAAGGYSDVPYNSWAISSIQSASDYKLMTGMSHGVFGYGRSISRGEFATVLARMFGWDTSSAAASFSDTAGHWASGYIEAAAAHDAIDAGGAFHPNAPITRQEMAVMLVRSLGYRILADKAASYAIPFTDVTENRGYIAVAYDIGMTNGVSATQFAPNSTATREQAAAMLVRLYEKHTAKTDWLHGFYAISSYSQIALTKQMDAVSLGWSRMTYSAQTGAVLNTTAGSGNVYGIPAGYESAVTQMKANGCRLSLSVFMDNTGSALSSLLSSAGARDQAVTAILREATRTYDALGCSPYSGVTIDFEGLAGSANRANFTAFLSALSQQLKAKGLTLTVTVMPATADGSYYNGYDYRAIGSLADKVILMAHDYQPASLSGFLGTEYYKNAALTPLTSVYYSLRAATDPTTGIGDTSKLVLAISCAANAWQTDSAGKLTAATPLYPTSQTVDSRLKGGAARGYSDAYRNPYLTYTTESGQHIFLWYEDSRSVGEKVRLAKLFGVRAVSLWRLGNLPDDSTAGLYYNVLSACS